MIGHLDQALAVAAAVGSQPGARSTSGWAGSLRNYQNYSGDHLHWGKGDVQHQKLHQDQNFISCKHSAYNQTCIKQSHSDSRFFSLALV